LWPPIRSTKCLGNRLDFFRQYFSKFTLSVIHLLKTLPSQSILQEDLSEKRFRALIENAHEGIIIYDQRGKIKYATPSIKKVSGYGIKDVIGRSGKEFVHEDFLDETRKVFKDLVQQPGKNVTLIQKLKHKKGHYFWAEALLTNFLHVPGIDGVVSNFRDITEKKIVEDQAQQTHGLLETISQNLSEGVYMGVLGKKYLHVNDAFLKIFGFKSLEYVQSIDASGLYVYETQRKQIIRDLKRNKKLNGVEAEFLRTNGEKFWGIMNITLLESKGKENYYVGTILDISKEKFASQKLIDSRNFLNDIVNTVAAPIFVKDEHLRWVMFNDPFCKFLQKTREEIMGKSDKDLLLKDEASKVLKIDSLVLQTGKTISYEEQITVNGETRHLLTVKSRNINERGEKFLIGSITDVTELKKGAHEINQLNANLKGVMESTSESIYALDTNFNYITFNKNHQRVMKLLYKADISIGTNKLKCIKESKDEKWLAAELKHAMKGNHFASEKKLDYPQYHDRYIQLTYNPVRDDNNNIVGVAVFVSDITDRKQTEARLKAVNEELTGQNWQLASREEELKIALEELSQRNFELDQLMYKTSHDLRSPLSSIMGLINLARLDSSSDSKDQYINKIEGRVQKLDEFIRSMLNYARANRADVSIAKINLEELTNNSIKELEYLDNFRLIKTKVSVKNPGIVFKSDPLRATIIFSNIISNAYKYYNAEVKSYLKINITITPLNATIVFQDNGIGIKTEYQDKIFNMFYRATERSQGSGLGMYIVKQAIEKLEGTINFKSEYGKGTTIKITLPNM
jgi:PAS domain S-box-containing protein